MRYLPFAPLGRHLSRLVLGTAAYRYAPPDVPLELLDAWLAAGGNVVDTAREYGESEAVLGRWMEARGCRDEVVVVTKCAHPDDAGPRLTPATIAADLAESLETLATDRVDVLLLHRDHPHAEVGPLLEALNEHREAGRVGAFGASNWTTARLQEATDYATAHGLEPFAASSPNLSLAVQREPFWPGTVSASDPESRAWYERTQLPVFAWSSQAGGFFARALDPDADAEILRVYGSAANDERRRRASELARARGARANDVALAWVLHQPFPVHAVVGPQRPEELRSCLAALAVELTPEDVRWLALDDE